MEQQSVDFGKIEEGRILFERYNLENILFNTDLTKKEIIDICGKVSYFINKGKTFDEICESLRLNEYTVEKFVELINAYKLKDKAIMLPSGIDCNSGKIIKKMLLLGDTHLCNKRDRIDILRYLYRKAEDLGVDTVLHSGDFDDGFIPDSAFQYSQLKTTSYEEHLDYCYTYYPRFSGKTYVIDGNHDEWWKIYNNKNILCDLASKRDDIIYLGGNTADLNIEGLKIKMLHGDFDDGKIEARKLNRVEEIEIYCRNLLKAIDIPDCIHLGHQHVPLTMTCSDICCYQTGSLIDTKRDLTNNKSVSWLTLIIDKEDKTVEVDREDECFSGRLKKRVSSTSYN